MHYSYKYLKPGELDQDTTIRKKIGSEFYPFERRLDPDPRKGWARIREGRLGPDPREG